MKKILIIIIIALCSYLIYITDSGNEILMSTWVGLLIVGSIYFVLLCLVPLGEDEWL